MSDDVRRHFDEVAADYDRWKQRATYYYGRLKSLLTDTVPRGSRVAEIGCGTGDILASLRPADGVGLDISPAMIERARVRHPSLRFAVHDILSGPFGGDQYDYVVAVDVLEHVDDPARALRSAAAMLSPGGRVVVITANPLWSAPLHLAERLRLKMPEGDHTWRSAADIEHAGRAAGLAVEEFERDFVVPKRVPGLHRLNDAALARPLRRRLGMIQLAVFTRSTT